MRVIRKTICCLRTRNKVLLCWSLFERARAGVCVSFVPLLPSVKSCGGDADAKAWGSGGAPAHSQKLQAEKHHGDQGVHGPRDGKAAQPGRYFQLFLSVENVAVTVTLLDKLAGASDNVTAARFCGNEVKNCGIKAIAGGYGIGIYIHGQNSRIFSCYRKK